MDGQSGSRALSAVSDLVELLRLTQGAAERVAQEVYGVSYEHAELIERELQRLRRSADKLKSDVEEHVSSEEASGVDRGEAVRRTSGNTPHN
jgi:hypothetical protein